MRIGKRLFPYPVLNNKQALSSYKPNCFFALRYHPKIRDEFLVLEDVFCNLKCPFLEKLIEDNKAEMLLEIECPQAMYIDHRHITTKPQEISIHASKIVGDVTLTALIVAKEDIVVKRFNRDFADEYADLLPINIERHDILAVHEENKEHVNFDMSEDLTSSSIFTIAVDHYMEEGRVSYVSSSDTIKIYLDEKAYTKYKNIGAAPAIRQFCMSLLAIPALEYCINDLVLTNKDNIEEALENTSSKWYVAFCNAFNKKYEHDFCEDDLPNLSETIQQLFNCPIGKSIVGLQDLVKKGETDHESEN